MFIPSDALSLGGMKSATNAPHTVKFGGISKDIFPKDDEAGTHTLEVGEGTPQSRGESETTGGIPNFLMPQILNKFITELRRAGSRKNLDKAFDVTEQVGALRSLADLNLQTGRREGANVAAEAAANARAAGVTNFNESAASASTQLPALQGKYQSEADIASLQTAAAEKKFEAELTSADAINRARLNYANLLAQIRAGDLTREQAASQFSQSLAADREKFDQSMSWDREKFFAGLESQDSYNDALLDLQERELSSKISSMTPAGLLNHIVYKGSNRADSAAGQASLDALMRLLGTDPLKA